MTEHPIEHEPFELTDDDVDDDEFHDMLEEEALKHVDPKNEALHGEIQTVQAEVDEVATNMSTVADSASVREKIVRPVERPDVATGDGTPNDDLTKKEAAAEQAEQAAAKAKEKTAQGIASKFVALAFGVAVVGVLVLEIIRMLKNEGDGGGKGDSAMSEATLALLKQRYQEWCNKPDPEFWKALADYVDSHSSGMSLGDQITFLNLVVLLAPDSGGFIWDNGGDQSALADELVRAYRAGGNTSSAAYRHAAVLSYQGEPVPRVATAQVLRLALAWVGVSGDQGSGS